MALETLQLDLPTQRAGKIVRLDSAYLAVEVALCLVPGLDQHNSIAVHNDEAICGILKFSRILAVTLWLCVEWPCAVTLTTYLDVCFVRCAPDRGTGEGLTKQPEQGSYCRSTLLTPVVACSQGDQFEGQLADERVGVVISDLQPKDELVNLANA